MQRIDYQVVANGKLRSPDPAEADIGAACACGRVPGGDGGALGIHDLSRDALEAELVGLRKHSKGLSEQARMAEIATTTLHNVRNVLNSVNVSASVVAQRLRQSRVKNIGKALQLLREHRGDLARFLAEDPKGRMLPGYLQTLAEHLAAEHTDLLREMEVLTGSLEHMKEIVAVQQSYARKCGVIETLAPAELVEDALRMNWGAFERHGVHIVREFGKTPPVSVDKHKVLQVLVNLLRNAKYAMDENEMGSQQKVLTLRICPGSERTVTISVRDNGIGIGDENLVRIFEQGFTTKRDGHGFGLRSGILSAMEMGGKLTAESEGVGKGAVFCLELPLAQKPAEQNEHARGTCDNLHQS